jgi:hypothetical protein
MSKSKPSEIPEHVKQQAERIVKTFNETVIEDPNRRYVTRFKGKYLYLDRLDYDYRSHMCRLNYLGQMDDWEFAIYKYSDGIYDPDEWAFPGSQHIDGTIEGAMKATLEAYPE